MGGNHGRSNTLAISLACSGCVAWALKSPRPCWVRRSPSTSSDVGMGLHNHNLTCPSESNMTLDKSSTYSGVHVLNPHNRKECRLGPLSNEG